MLICPPTLPPPCPLPNPHSRTPQALPDSVDVATVRFELRPLRCALLQSPAAVLATLHVELPSLAADLLSDFRCAAACRCHGCILCRHALVYTRHARYAVSPCLPAACLLSIYCLRSEVRYAAASRSHARILCRRSLAYTTGTQSLPACCHPAVKGLSAF